MDTKKIYSVSAEAKKNSFLNEQEYYSLYEQSIKDPNKFWDIQARQFIDWFSPFEKVTTGNFEHLNMRWFINGKLNACYNCLDRHLAKQGDKIALIWEGDEPNQQITLTYLQLYEEVCKFANVLKLKGVKKGDRVSIYMHMIPEVTVAMLACARMGAVHCVVFAGFSPASLKTRILDANCKIIITADEGMRGGSKVSLKHNVDEALKDCPQVDCVIVVKHTGNNVQWQTGRDVWYHDCMDQVDAICPCENLDADDPLFILYTSGSTGKPKGVLHSLGGYLVYAAMTHHYVFNYQPNDIYWCTADVGWITGHSYIVYGPLANGATTLIFEGIPTYPDASRFWQIIDKHQVNIFYTAPTAIRALRREGDEWVQKTSRKSLKLLGSVGEPINPEVWKWYYHVVGEDRCLIVDTWWQTETGGIMITALPGATPLQPGSAGWPFFGIIPIILDENEKEVAEGISGQLLITQPWPGLMKTIYGDHQRFVETYFKQFPGKYLTGDGAYKDKNGYYWIRGRNDDVMNVSGHRIGSEEVESALVSHQAVSESAVVGIPDEIKGEEIYAFVVLKVNVKGNDALKHELMQQVRHIIGAIAVPKIIQWTPVLPKTRSGKIMRRILRKIAVGDVENLGDISTLADPDCIKLLSNSG